MPSADTVILTRYRCSLSCRDERFPTASSPACDSSSRPRDELAWKRILKMIPGVGNKTANRVYESIGEQASLLAMRAKPEKSLSENETSIAQNLSEPSGVYAAGTAPVQAGMLALPSPITTVRPCCKSRRDSSPNARPRYLRSGIWKRKPRHFGLPHWMPDHPTSILISRTFC